MSKGLSWRQREMLVSIAEQVNRAGNNHRRPVAWRAIYYGPHVMERLRDSDRPAHMEWIITQEHTARVKWNTEQAKRCSLRSLEKRGLVELGRYSFRPNANSSQIFWDYTHPKDHVPGETRIMTGVVLTLAGMDIVVQELEKRKQ